MWEGVGDRLFKPIRHRSCRLKSEGELGGVQGWLQEVPLAAALHDGGACHCLGLPVLGFEGAKRHQKGQFAIRQDLVSSVEWKVQDALVFTHSQFETDSCPVSFVRILS